MALTPRVCNVTFDTPSNSLKYVYTCMPYQAVIVAYNGSNCMARDTAYVQEHTIPTLSLLSRSYHRLSVSPRGHVPAEQFCLRELEKKTRKKTGAYLLLGISQCTGIGSIWDPAGLYLGHLDVKVGRIGDAGDRRWSGSVCIGGDGFPLIRLNTPGDDTT